MASNSMLFSILVLLFLLKAKELKQGCKHPYDTVQKGQYHISRPLGSGKVFPNSKPLLKYLFRHNILKSMLQFFFPPQCDLSDILPHKEQVSFKICLIILAIKFIRYEVVL